MKHLVFTDRWLRALKPAVPGKRDEFADTVVPGLRLRVSETGSVSFSIFRRVGQGGDPVRRNIGTAWKAPLPHDVELPNRLADIRSQARQAIADMTAGVDPKEKAAEARRAEERRRADTFTAVFEIYEAEHLAKLRTGKVVAGVIRKHVIPVWGERPIADIRRSDWKELLRGLSMTTGANRLLAYLKHFFQWIVDEEIIEGFEESPLEAARRPNKENKRDRPLTEPEIRAVWRACGQLGVFGAAFKLLLATGQRRTECGSLTWEEVDRPGAVFRLAVKRTKAARAHEVPLSALALSIIAERPRVKGNSYVFSTGDGKPISGWNKATNRLRGLALVELRKELGEEAKFPEWKPHDFRHTCATFLGQLGVARVVITKALNHSDKGITAQYDHHDYRAEKREALEAWGAYITALLDGRPAGEIAKELRKQNKSLAEITKELKGPRADNVLNFLTRA
jgi:integrase